MKRERVTVLILLLLVLLVTLCYAKNGLTSQENHDIQKYNIDKRNDDYSNSNEYEFNPLPPLLPPPPTTETSESSKTSETSDDYNEYLGPTTIPFPSLLPLPSLNYESSDQTPEVPSNTTVGIVPSPVGPGLDRLVQDPDDSRTRKIIIGTVAGAFGLVLIVSILLIIVFIAARIYTKNKKSRRQITF
eukprot:TRINITY_DN26693_c0_g1_i1.p1 TRINITY_DN26693_c0_g1~~TRINITY_DN26693_c0_g1_i1.p1  ORF type:complete len:188 (-),score=25.19 TRINITY_DN26693_c0_g1_i1:8-571(-)